MARTSPPRVALLGFSIECNKFAPVATKAHFVARTYLEGDAIAAEARAPKPADAGGDTGFCRSDGRLRAVGSGRYRARDDRAQRPGRARVFPRIARHDRAQAARRAAGRRGLYLLARRGTDDRGGRSGRRAVCACPTHRRSRCADRRHPRLARQRVGADGAFARRVYRLSHQPASRHARARCRGRSRDPRNAGRHCGRKRRLSACRSCRRR